MLEVACRLHVFSMNGSVCALDAHLSQNGCGFGLSTLECIEKFRGLEMFVMLEVLQSLRFEPEIQQT